MNELPIRRSPSDHTVERRFRILYAASTGCAAAAVVLTWLTPYLICHGPFPEHMERSFLDLYENPYRKNLFSEPYTALRHILIVVISSWLFWTYDIGRWVLRVAFAVHQFIRSRLTMQGPILYRGARDWQALGQVYPLLGFHYCAMIAFWICCAYYDTKVRYPRDFPLSTNFGAYDPCKSQGINAPEFHACKSARRRLFAVQMMTLLFAVVPAAIHGLHFVVSAYQLYTAFAWMNRQLRTIRETRARRPEIDAELDALEAKDRAMKQEDGLKVTLGSKLEGRIDEWKTDVESKERNFEGAEVQ